MDTFLQVIMLEEDLQEKAGWVGLLSSWGKNMVLLVSVGKWLWKMLGITI